MRLGVARETYSNAGPIIVAQHWSRVTLTCNEHGGAILYVPLNAHGNGPAAGAGAWDSAPRLEPGETVELEDSVYVIGGRSISYRADYTP
jgi:hypothetical protein